MSWRSACSVCSSVHLEDEALNNAKGNAMYVSKCIVSALLIGCVAGVSADVLESWGDGIPNVDFLWSPTQRELVIINANGNEYKFWVHDGSEEPGTGGLAPQPEG